MKYLRAFLFVPGTFAAMILVNFLYSLLSFVVTYFYSDPSEISFIWESFLKSTFVTVTSIYAGIYIYPFKNKLPALITLTLFYIAMFIILYLAYYELWSYIKDLLNERDIKPQSLLNQLGITIGSMVGIAFIWIKNYKNEFLVD